MTASKTRRLLLTAGAAGAVGLGAGAISLATGRRAQAESALKLPVHDAGPLAVEPVAGGLDHPWSLAPLPEPDGGFAGRFLVSERPGRLRVVGADGRLSAPLAGLPAVRAEGQGGLLDVVLHPRFAQNRWVYWTYAEPAPEGRASGSALARGRLDEAGGRLQEVEVLFRQRPKLVSGHHYGSRLVWDREGRLFMTLGDRGSQRQAAQGLDQHLGKILRLDEQGRPAPGNPALATGAAPEVWSWGHRNVQGAALHPQTGELWAHEHGPQGGDELNRVQAGRNHGWPAITHGREYGSGLAIGEGTARPDVVPALRTWVPSIGPSGLAFVGGAGGPARYPGCEGQPVLGALRAGLVARLELDGPPEAPRLRREVRHAVGARVRELRAAPDGWLYLLTDEAEQGRLLRVARL